MAHSNAYGSPERLCNLDGDPCREGGLLIAPRSVPAIVLVGLLSFATLGPAGAPEAAAASAFCSDPEEVPGQGPSCRVEGGWLVELSDGAIVLTHGADVAIPGEEATPAVNAPSDPVCVSQSDPGVWLIYAVPSDKPDRFGSMINTIADTLRAMNGHLNEAAIETGGGDVDYRVVCNGAGQILVWGAQLPTASASDSFSTIAGDLRAMGFTSTTGKFLVFYDDQVGASNVCGQGTVHVDSTLSPNNANNAGPDFAVVYNAFAGCGQGWKTPMHELAHNMGAVQNDAPRASGAFHCNDGWDVMCYQDGGASQCTTGGFDCINTCTDFAHFDCGHDTYFHTNPPVGSYLQTHWNLGNSMNRFLSFGSPICTATGIVVVYRDANFLGGCKAFNANDIDLANDFLSDGAWANDEISSIKVAPGWRITAYEHASFAGASSSFSGSNAGVGVFDDRISSIVLDPCDPNAAVTFYQDINFAGGCKSFNANDATLVDDVMSNGAGMNDQVTSMRVKPGRIASIYGDINFQGWSADFAADTSFVGSGWNDQASSVTIVTRNAPCDTTAVLVVYDLPGRTGPCRSFDFSEGYLSDNLFNDGTGADNRISSFRIQTGYLVQWYTGDAFTGSASGGFFSDGDLGADLSNTASSFKIHCSVVEFETGVAVPRAVCDPTPDLL